MRSTLRELAVLRSARDTPAMVTPDPSTKPTRAAKPSVRERVDALRNLRPFLVKIWATSPALTLATLALRLLRALLPVAMLYVGKLIIDEVVRLVALDSGLNTLRAGWDSGLLAPLLGLLALEFGLAVLSDVLGRIVALVDQLLSELFTNALSMQLMEHAARLDLEDFEDSELQDRLDRARRQTMGRMTLMEPGVRPCMARASLPTATSALSRLCRATTDGSLTTMPCPLTYTRMLAVPRSMPAFLGVMNSKAIIGAR